MVLTPADTDTLCALLHRLALRRGVRVAPSRVADALAEQLAKQPSGHPQARLRAAAAALGTLGLPARAVRLPWREARMLGHALCIVEGDSTGEPLLLCRRGRRLQAERIDGSFCVPAPGSHVMALDLRAPAAAATLGSWLWASITAERVHVLGAVAALVLAQALGLVGPAVAWLVTDRALPDGASGLLVLAVLGMVAISLHAAAVGWWRDRISRTLDQRLRTRAGAMMFEALLNTSYAQARSQPVGEGLTLLSSAENVAASALGLGLAPMVGLAGGVAAWLALQSMLPTAAHALALAALAVMASAVPLARANTRWQGRELSARAAQQSLLHELLQGAPALRVAGAEHAGAKRWLRRLVDQQTAVLGQVRSGLWLDMLFESGLQLARVGWLVWAAQACLAGDISLGVFLAGAMLAEQVMRQAIGMAHTLIGLVALKPHWQRINAALAAPRSASPSPDGAANGAAALRLEDVWFRYGAGSEWVVRGYSLEVPAGALVMLSGVSGAGKTTLLRLAAGLLAPEKGNVEVFGRPPGAGSLAYLPQEAPLFEGSIASNLQWLANTTAQRILDAARRSGLDDWVQTLPMGYATRVPAGGGAVSGGQRQLIALTAVLAGEAPLLLLDEPMSQLDRLSRQRLLDSGLFAGRTVVIISHDKNGLDAETRVEDVVALAA